MKYNSAVVTISGGSFLSNVIANKQSPTLDKMIILNQDLPNDKSLESMTMQDFSNGLSFDINNVSQNGNSFTATSVVTNKGIEQDYQAKLIGITGYTDQSNKQLIAVSQATEPFTIEKESDTPLKLIPSITIGFSNSNNITITMKDDVYIAKKDLKGTLITLGFATHEDIANVKSDLQKDIDTKADKEDMDNAVKNINSNISGNTDLINKLNNSSLQYIRDLNSNDDLNNIQKQGLYKWYIDFPKNSPDAQDAMLIVLETGFTIKQIVISSWGDGFYTSHADYERENPNNIWSSWRKIITSEDLAELQNKIDNLSENSLKFNGIIGKGFDDMTETGIFVNENPWDISGKTDNPDTPSGHGYLIVIKFSDNYIYQKYFDDHNYNGERFKVNGKWTNWKTISTSEDINNLSNQLSTKANQSDLISSINNINSNLEKKANQNVLDNLSDNTFMYRGKWEFNNLALEHTTELRDGYYDVEINKDSTLEDFSGLGILSKKSFNNFIQVTLYDLLSGIVFNNTYRNNYLNDNVYWTGWKKLGGVEQLLKFVNNNFVKNDDNEFIDRGWVGSQDINTLTKPGIYHFDPASKNLPEYGWGVLYVTNWLNNAGNGDNTHQRIEINGKNYFYYRGHLSGSFTKIGGV